MTRRLLSIMAVASLASACAPDPGVNLEEPEQPRTFELLTSMKLSNGNTFEFYEAEPGVILISEAGPWKNSTTLTGDQIKSLSIPDLYRFVSGEVELPVKLVSAVQRREKLGLADDSRPGDQLNGQVTGDIGRTLSALRTHGGYSCTTANQIGGTWPNGAGFDGHTTFDRDRVYDAHYYAAMVCNHPQQTAPVSMSAHYRRWWTWKTYDSWTVNSGYWRYWTHTDYWYDFDAETRVYNWSANNVSVTYSALCDGYCIRE